MKTSKPKLKWLIVPAILIFFVLFYALGLHKYLSFEYLKSQQNHLSGLVQDHFFVSVLLFFLGYTLLTTIAFPGASILTILAGALFGFWKGLILVSFASSIGSTLCFLLGRTLFKDWVQEKFGKGLKPFNDGIQKEGAFYLFSIRLIPLFPLFVVNLALALTPIKTWVFYWVSQVGMLAGTAVYVNAGTQLSKLENLSGIASPSLLVSFVLLGLFPLLVKKALPVIKKIISKK